MYIQTAHLRPLVDSVGGMVVGMLVLSTAGSLGVSLAEGQSRTAPSFEVTSVKPVERIPRSHGEFSGENRSENRSA